MKTLFIVLLLILSAFLIKAQPAFVRLVTSKGNITLLLYDKTPNHRDIFLQNIKNGLFKKSSFNRVIKSFVSQAGELDESILEKEKLHPEVPVKRIAAEIRPDLFHKKGALGMGRNDNPEKNSYVNQIYLVEGKKLTDAELDVIEQKKGIKFSLSQRIIYKTLGGIPRLDMDYTIFGEVVEGIAVAEAINSVPTSKDDLPLTPVIFTPVILSQKEAAKLWKKIRVAIEMN